jgi:hypothetical protein
MADDYPIVGDDIYNNVWCICNDLQVNNNLSTYDTPA